jgi:hypothetical protein
MLSSELHPWSLSGLRLPARPRTSSFWLSCLTRALLMSGVVNKAGSIVHHRTMIAVHDIPKEPLTLNQKLVQKAAAGLQPGGAAVCRLHRTCHPAGSSSSQLSAAAGSLCPSIGDRRGCRRSLRLVGGNFEVRSQWIVVWHAECRIYVT